MQTNALIRWIKEFQVILLSLGDITGDNIPEGSKRKIEVVEEETYKYTDVKYVKNVITF